MSQIIILLIDKIIQTIMKKIGINENNINKIINYFKYLNNPT